MHTIDGIKLKIAVISDLHLGSKWGTEREEDPFDQAREAFERAVALDPSFARAHAGIANTHLFDYIEGSTDSPERSIQRSLEMVEHALALEDRLRFDSLGRPQVAERLGDVIGVGVRMPRL